MMHIIYLSIIAFMFYWLLKAYSFANKKHKELIKFKETNMFIQASKAAEELRDKLIKNKKL